VEPISAMNSKEKREILASARNRHQTLLVYRVVDMYVIEPLYTRFWLVTGFTGSLKLVTISTTALSLLNSIQHNKSSQ
jgi:hypothetical protein